MASSPADRSNTCTVLGLCSVAPWGRVLIGTLADLMTTLMTALLSCALLYMGALC